MPSIGSFSHYADLMDKNRPPEEVWAERIALLKEGIPVIEGLANLAQLLNEKNIVFVGFPLAIADRSGAPDACGGARLLSGRDVGGHRLAVAPREAPPRRAHSPVLSIGGDESHLRSACRQSAVPQGRRWLDAPIGSVRCARSPSD